jgi:ribosome biogenesis GTPase A
MVATQKTIRELAPYVSAFIEVVDARAPLATRHRPLLSWIGRKPLVMVLNKGELADPHVTARWVKGLASDSRILSVVALTATDPGARSVLTRVLSAKLPVPRRLSVVGLPNVGKSTLLNRMVGRNRVATGAKPGLTRGPQWIRPGDGWEWLDLPGVVTPSKTRDWRLKALGVVALTSDEVEEVAEQLSTVISEELLGNLETWGRRRGFLVSGGRVDHLRTAQAVLTEFRKGKFGPISLERPE